MSAVVGILSDSHGRWERTQRAIDALQARGASVFVHCGDVEDERVLDQLAGLEAHLVWGNCDWDRARLERYARDLGVAVHGSAGQIELDGRRIAFTHGHEPALLRAPIEAGAEYVAHGHTHEMRDERIGASRVVNPGALHRAPRFTVARLVPALDTLEFLEVSA
jgi:putative phosphoesterase